jgi:ATP-dependent Clp protease, protease subunit
VSPAASRPDDPWFPGIPPEVPFPPGPVPGTPPGRPSPMPPTVPIVPVPGSVPAPADELRSLVYERLLERRTVMLDRALDAEAATLIAAQLMSLDHESAEPVTLVVNSPGGPLDAAAAVLDTVDLVRGTVDTTCIGQAAGTAAVVLAAGTGTRRIGAGAQVRLRFPEVELSGRASSIDAEVARVDSLRRAVLDRLADRTGQERRLLERDVESGRSLTAPEAVTYGLADELIAPGRGPAGPGPAGG